MGRFSYYLLAAPASLSQVQGVKLRLEQQYINLVNDECAHIDVYNVIAVAILARGALHTTCSLSHPAKLSPQVV